MSGQGDPSDPDGESFASLIGETREIDRGPRKAAIPSKKPDLQLNRDVEAKSAAFRFPEPDEPRLAAAHGVSDARLLALRRADPEPEERIDLHGLRRDAAARLIARRLESARARGLRCVAVIHGRGRGSENGEPVLRESVPDWLSKPPCASHVLAFAPAPVQWGGEGAMIVLLRRRGR